MLKKIFFFGLPVYHNLIDLIVFIIGAALNFLFIWSICVLKMILFCGKIDLGMLILMMLIYRVSFPQFNSS